MNINEYISRIQSLVQTSSIVSSYDFTIDRKTEDIAFLSGRVDFTDGTTLDLKEFVEETETGIEKYKYGYNYREGLT